MNKSIIILVFAVLISGVGVGGVSAAETPTDTPTSTPTATPTNTTNRTQTTANNTTATSLTRAAELDITQAGYVDGDVGVERSQDGITYKVQGESVLITPANFKHGNVVGATVKEDEAALQYVDKLGAWRLTATADGTYSVAWTVITDNGRTITYRAVISVTGTQAVHIPQKQYEETQNDAQNWQQSVISPLKQAEVGLGEVTDKKAAELLKNRGIPWIKFTSDPTSALRGTLLSLITIILLTPGGWVFGIIFVGVPLSVIAALAARVRSAEAKLGDVDSVEQAKSRIQQHEAKKLLSQMDVGDAGIPERYASVLRQELGSDLWQVANSIPAAISPAAIRQIHLSAAVSDSADWIVTDSNDVVRDDSGQEGTPVEECNGDRLAEIPLSELPASPLKQGVTIDSLVNVSGADADTLSDVIDNHADQEGINTALYDSGSDYAECLARVLETADSTEYSTKDSETDSTRLLLNVLASIVESPTEQYQQSFWRRYRDALLYASEELSAAEELSDEMDRTSESGINTGDQR